MQPRAIATFSSVLGVGVAFLPGSMSDRVTRCMPARFASGEFGCKSQMKDMRAQGGHRLAIAVYFLSCVFPKLCIS